MPELTEIEIPDSVSEYIEPLSGSAPIGTDASNDAEYFKLNMEIPKPVPDYKKWVELCTLILKDKSKDIKAAAWLSFAFYRTEGIKGFNLGLNIILFLLKRFGADLFPSNQAHKQKALQFLSSSRVTKFLEKEQVDKSNLNDFNECERLINDITVECSIILPGNENILKPLGEVIFSLIESAQVQSEPLVKEDKKEPPPPAPVSPAREFVQQTSKPEPEIKSASQPAVSSSISEEDITVQLRRNISLLFEYEEDGIKKQRVPEFPGIFAVSRIIQWSSLIRPADNGGNTQVELPNKVIQALIKDWYSKGDTDLLISRIESEFIKENSTFRFWIDAQRYLILSLEAKGGSYKQSAEDVKDHLSALLNRIKDLQHLKFKDKQTPFADSQTTKWLSEEIINRRNAEIRNTTNNHSIIVDEIYNSIMEDYNNILNDPQESFENNLMKMQAGLNGDERKKGKFLRRLNMADYCYKHKEYNLARAVTLELKQLIDQLNLSQWEPSLCTSLWQLHYMINKEIISHTKDENISRTLMAEQEELFYQLAKYNGVLALNLTKQTR